MKTKLISLAFLLAASFNVVAQDSAADLNDPTVLCNDSLAVDARFSVIADKMILGYAGAVRRAVQRTASTQERAAIGQWIEARKACFEAGVAFRSAHMTAEETTYARSAFVFQQILALRLRDGQVTYTGYNRQSLQLAAASMQEDL